ncbi:unnamed protein product [Durusdinium trenchii]|uniref:PDZ domain-containing protein n=2 Tax=Durusdinium trenchii TaxID=1381693 RepID=A0ABP0K152_9DINO
MLHVSVMGFLQRAARNELRRAAVPVAVVGSMRRGWQTLKKRRSFLTLSPAAKGQTGDDLIMGERAAARTNQALNKISGMYVGKNMAVSKKVADNLEKAFGKAKSPGLGGPQCRDVRAVEFAEGPIGLEIQWTTPPVVVGVVPGGAGENASIQKGQALLEINGCPMTEALPEMELEELMQQRPLRLAVATLERVAASATSSRADAVRHKGVTKFQSAVAVQTAAEVLELVHEEHRRCIHATLQDHSLAQQFFSNVQVPRASEGAPVTRWDLRLPMEPLIYRALEELLGRSSGEEGAGATLEDLAGPDAELWELGVVVTEPGAAPQAVHFDAAERCLYTAFLALQDVTYEMGPTHFWPGTNTPVAHRRFEDDPGCLEAVPLAAPLLQAGDLVMYDSRLLHCGGGNTSTQTRALLYITFRDQHRDPQSLGIHQHSIRPSLAGRFRLRQFRP